MSLKPALDYLNMSSKAVKQESFSEYAMQALRCTLK